MSAWRHWEWNPQIDWNSPAGVLLSDFALAIYRDGDLRETPLNVFGSSPLEMGLGIALNSLDVDVEPDQFYIIAQKFAKDAKLTIGHGRSPYLQIVPPGVFRASKTWIHRAEIIVRHGITFRFAHPIDIIIGKLFRLDAKDYQGIDRIFEEIKRPTRDDLLYYLTNYTDLFSSDSESLRRFCDHIEIYSAYREWEMIEANQIREMVLAEIKKIYSESDVTEKRLFKSFGESSLEL